MSRALFPLCVCALIAACSSDGERGPAGPAGPRGEQGDPGADGSPDTAQQVLDKLLTVDGTSSGLDADTVQGIDPEEFSRRGLRGQTLTFSSSQNAPQTSNSVRLPESDGVSVLVRYNWVVPPDFRTGTDITLVTYPQAESIGICGARLTVSANVQMPEMTDNFIFNDAVDVAVERAVIARLATVFSFPYDFESTTAGTQSIEPGTIIRFSVGRISDDVGDNCVGDVLLNAVEVQYVGG